MTVEFLCGMLMKEVDVDIIGEKHQHIDNFKAGEVKESPYKTSLIKDYFFVYDSLVIKVVF